MKVFSPRFLGEIYLFCKGADSSIFPRVIEGKVDQIQSRVERNAVVRRRGGGGGGGGGPGGSRVPSSGAPPPAAFRWRLVAGGASSLDIRPE